MTRDEIRSHVINFLKSCASEDYKKVVNDSGIAHIQNVRDIFRTMMQNGGLTQPESEWGPIVLEIINELVNNGLLAFGHKTNFDANTFGFVSVTEYGKDCFEQDNILPYDPDGYLREYISNVPSADQITLQYLGESITAYNRNLLLSSAITLGVASENAILLLVESFVQAISDQNRKSRFESRIRNRWISTQFSEFRQELTQFQNQLPTNLRQDLDTYLDGIFNFIRLNRNQAGHPTGTRPTKKVALHNIQMFVDYSKRVFELKDFFENNSLT